MSTVHLLERRIPLFCPENKPARIKVLLAVNLLIMWYTLKRIFFDGGRPIDYTMLVIEGLVLALIAYEVVIGIKERRKTKHRQALVDKRVIELSQLIESGQEIRSAVPNPNVGPDLLSQLRVSEEHWMGSVKKWTSQVDTLLSSYSPRASSKFMLITNFRPADNTAFTSLGTATLRGPVREHYQCLSARLNNLIAIMESPSAYLWIRRRSLQPRSRNLDAFSGLHFAPIVIYFSRQGRSDNSMKPVACPLPSWSVHASRRIRLRAIRDRGVFRGST
jgi:hypothetical protein